MLNGTPPPLNSSCLAMAFLGGLSPNLTSLLVNLLAVFSACGSTSEKERRRLHLKVFNLQINWKGAGMLSSKRKPLNFFPFF